MYHPGLFVLAVALFAFSSGAAVCWSVLSFRRDRSHRRVIQSSEVENSILLEAQKMELVSRLARGVAHDFNNKLAVVIGNLDLIQNRFALDAGVMVLVGRASEAARRGALLVQQLLSFSRQATLEPKLTRIDLPGIRPLLESSLRDAISLEIYQNPDLWCTRIDLVQLHAALLSLCLNARDAISGRGRVIILTDNMPTPDGDHVLIEMRDTGCGMDDETAAKAFDPFFTTKGPQHSGLGLSQVQGFVRQSQGKVWLTSKPGQGTTVHILLRREVDISAEEAATCSCGRKEAA